MIRGYSDHAANERTFLAWIRTGIAVIAFGFVVEKFNLFLRTLAGVSLGDAGHRISVQQLSGPLGRYDGLALVIVGIVLILFAAAHFVRTTRLLDDEQVHPASSIRVELALSAVLGLMVAVLCAYLAFG
jgi:putative membrane protein